MHYGYIAISIFEFEGCATHMEWYQLEYFQIVARTEHFTQAAEKLSISQPALSRSISNLERELGTELFDRHGRRITLNGYGKAFLEYVELALQNVEDGKRKVQELLGVARGTISLAFLHTLGVHLVPDLVEGFYKKYPNVQFELSQNVTEILIEQLQSGTIDLCLSLPPDPRLKIQWYQLFSEELYVIVPKNHPLAGHKSIRLIEIAEEPFICLKHGIGLRGITDNLCTQAGFEPKIAFEGEEIPTIVGLVSVGLGVSLIPSVPGLDFSRVSLLRVTEPISGRDIGIAWIENRNISMAAERFRDYVLDRAKLNGSSFRLHD